MTRLRAASLAFREPSIVTNILQSDNFSDVDARRMRYALYWAYYENTAYRDIHAWAVNYKVQHGLYRYIRSIRNPAKRLGDFWQTHLWGGLLDPEAGDGMPTPSALPIIIPDDGNELLRPAIAKLWEWSNWQQKKDIETLYGSTMGDAGIRVVDNFAKEKVMLEVVHPAQIRELIKDDFGFVKAYLLEEERPDPRNPNAVPVTYSEKVFREPDSDDVIFQTFLDGSLYPWATDAQGNPIAEWVEPYGFIPFVHIPNIDVGDITDGWGLAEMHSSRVKFNEIDDLASKTDDQIRKLVAGAWFLAGSTTSDKLISGKASSTDKPQPGREELPIFASPNENAKITSMIHDLDLQGVNETIRDLDKAIERELPELQLDSEMGANLSGEALRRLEQKVTSKVIMRRPAYDRGLVHAQAMAITIAGFRGYGVNEGNPFAGLGLESFERGDLQHSIGTRPVFAQDELARLEESRVLWETAKLAVEGTGVSIEAFMEFSGVSDEKIRALSRMNRRIAGNVTRQQARNGNGDGGEEQPTEAQTTESENIPDEDVEAF